MALTQEQVQRLRQMSPENRRAFHLNRIATSLEEIQGSLKELGERLRPTDS
jgi:Asp-tRNA(Asn)/Glu-tRNA(Gln) amidotransferase C subunit